MDLFLKKVGDDKLEICTSEKCRRYGAIVPNDHYEWVSYKSFFDYYLKLIDKTNSIVDIVLNGNILLIKTVEFDGFEPIMEEEKVTLDSEAFRDQKFMEGISFMLTRLGEEKATIIESLLEEIAYLERKEIKPISVIDNYFKNGRIEGLTEEKLELVKAYIEKRYKRLLCMNFKYPRSKYIKYCIFITLITVLLSLTILGTFIYALIVFPSASLEQLNLITANSLGAVLVLNGSIAVHLNKKHRTIAFDSLKKALNEISPEGYDKEALVYGKIKEIGLQRLSRTITPSNDEFLMDIFNLVQEVYKNPYDGSVDDLVSILEVAKNYVQNMEDREIVDRCFQSYVSLKRKIEKSKVRKKFSTEESTIIIDTIDESIELISEDEKKHVISPVSQKTDKEN